MISGTRAQLTAEISRQQRLAAEIARGQADISTTKRIQAPSDDPAAAARVAQLRQTQANQVVWKANIDSAASLASRVDGNMAGIETSITRARELITAGSTGTLTASDRAAIAIELRGIVDDLNGYAAETDSRGYPLYPAGQAVSIPIDSSVRVQATSTREAVFEGVETADGPKTLAEIVGAAADAIELPDDPDPADPTSVGRVAASTAALAAIEKASDHIAAVRGEQGVRAARIDAVGERLASTGLLIEEERGNLEGTDITATVARVNAKMLSLDAAQAVFARINKSTLFDLLG